MPPRGICHCHAATHTPLPGKRPSPAVPPSGRSSALGCTGYNPTTKTEHREGNTDPLLTTKDLSVIESMNFKTLVSNCLLITFLMLVKYRYVDFCTWISGDSIYLKTLHSFYPQSLRVLNNKNTCLPHLDVHPGACLISNVN